MLFPLAVFLLNTTPCDVSWLNSYDSISYGLFDSMEDLRENVRVVHIDGDAQSTLAPSQMFFLDGFCVPLVPIQSRVSQQKRQRE